MTTLTLDVSDELMGSLCNLARQEFRTPEGQALWLLRAALEVAARQQLQPSRVPKITREERLRTAAPVFAELQALHLLAGRPSYRTISARVERQNGTKLSHTHAAAVIAGQSFPSWEVLRKIVTALDGDLDRFLNLWVAASSP